MKAEQFSAFTSQIARIIGRNSSVVKDVVSAHSRHGDLSLVRTDRFRNIGIFSTPRRRFASNLPAIFQASGRDLWTDSTKNIQDTRQVPVTEVMFVND